MKKLPLIIILIIVCSCSQRLGVQKVEYLNPETDNFVGEEYDNELVELNNDGVPESPITYFAYSDFEAVYPIQELVVDAPYDTIEDINNVPKKYLHAYLVMKVDSTLVNRFSKMLYLMKEPILRNKYLGFEMYRFIWSRSFHDDFIFDLTRKGRATSIIWKRIDKSESRLINKGETKLSDREYNEFKDLVIKSKYWVLPSYEWVLGNDGSYWIIEAHTPTKYKILCRWSPDLVYEDDISLRQLGQWMIERVGLKNEKIY